MAHFMNEPVRMSLPLRQWLDFYRLLADPKDPAMRHLGRRLAHDVVRKSLPDRLSAIVLSKREWLLISGFLNDISSLLPDEERETAIDLVEAIHFELDVGQEPGP